MRSQKMSVVKQKNSNRYKKYTLIIGALMNFGSMNTVMIAEAIGMSHSSTAKALRVLNESGAVNTSRVCGVIYYSLPNIPCAAVIDVSGPKYALHICSSDGTCQISKYYRHDDRYFTDENLAFFLKNCALMLISGNFGELPLHLITDDDFISKYKKLQNSYNHIAPIIAKHFNLKKSTLSNYQSCIEHSLRHHIGCSNTLLFTVHNDRILMAYVSDTAELILTPVRSIDTAEIIPSACTDKTAASLAYAVGNTISLLNVKRIIFDCCNTFSDPKFIGYFTTALEKFIENSTADIKISQMNYPLLLGGALFACHRRYLSLINDFED